MPGPHCEHCRVWRYKSDQDAMFIQCIHCFVTFHTLLGYDQLAGRPLGRSQARESQQTHTDRCPRQRRPARRR